MNRPATITVAVLATVLVLCGLGVASLGGSNAAAYACTPNGIDISGTPVTIQAGDVRAVGGWNQEQVANAAVVVTVGAGKGIPARGWVIAVATAMVESSLINTSTATDHDSIGLFQQRPSQGWGTPAQLADPVYATGAFYTALLRVQGWETMPLDEAAQAVQHSAFPTSYTDREHDAEQVVAYVISANPSAIPAALGQCLNNCPTLAAGSSTDSGGCAASSAIFARAETWLTAWSGGPVPYLSSGDPGSWFHGYRRDCSGYVSMALGLPGPGLNTAGLAARSTILDKADLRPGDLLINTAPDLRGHVVLFDRWTDSAMTSYVGYEQTGDGGTHHRRIPYPYFGGYPMTPYRFGTA